MTVAVLGSPQALAIGVCVGFACGCYAAFVAYWLVMPGRRR